MLMLLPNPVVASTAVVLVMMLDVGVASVEATVVTGGLKYKLRTVHCVQYTVGNSTNFILQV